MRGFDEATTDFELGRIGGKVPVGKLGDEGE
jgi:hypothetical protein